MEEITTTVGTQQQQCRTLILGDDNFTFTLPFIESRHRWPHETIEVASCLPEDKIPNEFRPNYLALKAQGIEVHFSINPAQLRNHFFNGQYTRMVFVLPGLAFAGFPDFLDKQHDPLFKLRLHMYMFGFLKSSRNALTQDSLIQIVWPRQGDKPELPQWVPWHGMDLPKIGPFCEVFRAEADDEPLDIAAFQDWHPLIHNVQTDCCPPYLQDTMFYCWRLSPQAALSKDSNASGEGSDKTAEEKDTNLLFVPPELWTHPVEAIPHVNELFKFEMKTNSGELLVVSKPTLKFDPRFRADGAPAKNPFAKRGALSSGGGGRGRGRGRGQPPAMSGGIPPNGPPGVPVTDASRMPPPPPPPPELMAASSGVDAGGYPPLHHPLMMYVEPPMMAAHQGPPGAAAAAAMMRRDILLQDELSMQYGDPHSHPHHHPVALHAKRQPRYDLLDAELLATGEFDAYREMELGLPMTDQYGVPIYEDLMSGDPAMGGLMGMDHQDVLLYERQGGLASQGDILQPSAHNTRQRLLDEEALLAVGAPINDPMLMGPSEMLADPRMMAAPMRGGEIEYLGERPAGPSYRPTGAARMPLPYYEEAYAAPPLLHRGEAGHRGELGHSRDMGHRSEVAHQVDVPQAGRTQRSYEDQNDLVNGRVECCYSDHYDESEYRRTSAGREYKAAVQRSSSGDRRVSREEPSERVARRSRSPKRGRRPDSRGPPPQEGLWQRQRSRSRSRGPGFRSSRRGGPSDQRGGGRPSPPRGTGRPTYHNRDDERGGRSNRYLSNAPPPSHRKITMSSGVNDRSRSRERPNRYSRSPARKTSLSPRRRGPPNPSRR